MPASADEIERRRSIALHEIRNAIGTADDVHNAKLFITHHIAEIDDAFWLKHCGVARPTTKQILNILVLQSHWGEHDNEGIDNFDFTLPDDVPHYVINVKFDKNGNVSGVAMES